MTHTLIKLLGVSLLAISPIVSSAQNYPLSDPTNSAGWILNEQMSDEFSGSSLDSTKWEPLDWSGRMPVEHSIDQVSLVNGEAVLEVDFKPGETTIAETAYTIDAGYFMSIDFQRYGYFEIRMKAQNYPIVTTWWLTGGEQNIQSGN